MIEKHNYGILEQKTRCAIYGRIDRLINEDGELLLQCSGSNGGCNPRCNAPAVHWEDLAAAVNNATGFIKNEGERLFSFESCQVYNSLANAFRNRLHQYCKRSKMMI